LRPPVVRFYYLYCSLNWSIDKQLVAIICFVLGAAKLMFEIVGILLSSISVIDLGVTETDCTVGMHVLGCQTLLPKRGVFIVLR
jgi:hypothetical protein